MMELFLCTCVPDKYFSLLLITLGQANNWWMWWPELEMTVPCWPTFFRRIRDFSLLFWWLVEVGQKQVDSWQYQRHVSPLMRASGTQFFLSNENGPMESETSQAHVWVFAWRSVARLLVFYLNVEWTWTTWEALVAWFSRMRRNIKCHSWSQDHITFGVRRVLIPVASLRQTLWLRSAWSHRVANSRRVH